MNLYLTQSKRQDLCCETHIKRKDLITKIIDCYKKRYADSNDYENWLSNDITLLVGVYNQMMQEGDNEGLSLTQEMEQRMQLNGKNDIKRIKRLLMELPLYFLLSLLGYAHYSNE
jgi:hypothetical protein